METVAAVAAGPLSTTPMCAMSDTARAPVEGITCRRPAALTGTRRTDVATPATRWMGAAAPPAVAAEV